MRKVILLMHMSLDGFVAGPNGELEWIRAEGEIFEYAIELTKSVDTAIFGRVTYQGMESYWPTVPANPESTALDLQHAHWIENACKLVFSKSLEKVEWNNSRLIRDNITEEMAKLKQQPGKNMMIFGSPSIAQTFMQLGLIDEYRLNLNPIILGSGIPLFKDSMDTINLKLVETKTFSSGVLGLNYQPER
jgi:dihydrofolate reductase